MSALCQRGKLRPDTARLLKSAKAANLYVLAINTEKLKQPESIMLAGIILRDRKFRTHWNKHRLTDVRPVVIRNGEMGLSRALRKCVSTKSWFKALFNATGFAAVLKSTDDTKLDRIVDLNRRGSVTPAQRFGSSDQLEAVTDKYTVELRENADLGIEKISMHERSRSRICVDSFSNLNSAIADSIRHGESNALKGTRETVLSNSLNHFTSTVKSTSMPPSWR